MAYNEKVPTPFYHLSVAYELLEQPTLSKKTKSLLSNHLAAFLFGKTAPDVQVASKQRREETHFYSIPPQEGDPSASEKMLSAYPHLGDGRALPAVQAVFIAGYLCHLQADLAWLLEIFLPVFGPDAGWQTFRQRLFLHNVLRAYLDRAVIAVLPADTGQRLAQVTPKDWLPFVDDSHLVAWRDFLAAQLRPGAAIQTVEVFADRQGVSTEAYYGLLDSEERLQAEIFSHLPSKRLATYRARLVEQNLGLLRTYFKEE